MATSRASPLNIGRKDGLSLKRDLANDLILQCQDVAHLLFIALCPEMPVISGINQLGRNANPVPGPHHGALDYRIHVELGRDLP